MQPEPIVDVLHSGTAHPNTHVVYGNRLSAGRSAPRFINVVIMGIPIPLIERRSDDDRLTVIDKNEFGMHYIEWRDPKTLVISGTAGRRQIVHDIFPGT